MSIRLAPFCTLLLLAAPVAAQRPIIDMHFHVLRFSDRSVVSAAEETLKRFNIVRAVTSGPALDVGELAKLAPDRVLSAPLFPVLPENFGLPSFMAKREWPRVDELRRAMTTRTYHALAEITSQYEGLAADGWDKGSSLPGVALLAVGSVHAFHSVHGIAQRRAVPLQPRDRRS